MKRRYHVLRAHSLGSAEREFATDVLVGLTERPKRISSRWFYDAHGSELFAEICDQEAYYLTRVEHEILSAQAEDFVSAFRGTPFNLVDLGAGDGRKTVLLLDAAQRLGLDCRYVPIDVSESALDDLIERMQARYPDLEIEGVVSEYLHGIEWLVEQAPRRASLVAFLGSNVGNFDRAGAARFLRRLWNALLADDGLLIGFDLKKDPDVLLAAYNDPRGLTRRFNLNLLTRINRELGGHFDLQRFAHFGTYNVFSGAMESYLLSLCYQEVRIDALERSFTFKPFEPLHTEYSFKYLDEDVLRMAQETGFAVQARHWDDEHRFCDALWRVVKAS
ncbi:MAG: L-histidine N(alpha)-methyltransferase [Planctomycetes bacterium]|nr:L-histidine N(alpha)-methyltransferase [Planctomycetota bacterium]